METSDEVESIPAKQPIEHDDQQWCTCTSSIVITVLSEETRGNKDDALLLINIEMVLMFYKSRTGTTNYPCLIDSREMLCLTSLSTMGINTRPEAPL
jgi:hypothetical protein